MMLVAVAVALVLGLLIGGRPENLSQIRFRWGTFLFVAVVVRYGTEAAIRYGVQPVEALRFPLYVLAFAAIAAILWANRAQPGLLLAAAGVTSNGLAVVLNGGWMPVWRPALELVGMTPADLAVSFHRLLPEQLGLEFLLRGGPFGDLIPVPLPVLTNVASIGDAFVAAGLAWYVFATLVAAPEAEEPAVTAPVPDSAADGRVEAAAARDTVLARPPGILVPSVPLRPRPSSSGPPNVVPRAGVGVQAALGGPVLLGGAGNWRGLAPQPRSTGLVGQETTPAYALPLPRLAGQPGLRARAASHPYVRLALDARFAALWVGQTISLLGDRLNQVALGVLVLSLTGSALDVGLTFLAATLPNLLFGPFAGALVDRWEQKRVMVASDLIRAGLVLAIPLAAQRGVVFVYPVVFAVTTVSIFFRPARAAVLPRIVPATDLTPANSAMATAETVADLAGYPLAGLLVAFLGAALTLAFWLDAASYLVSGALILSMAIPPVLRTAGPIVTGVLQRLLAEVHDGWRFLRSDPALLQNTLISGVAQLSTGTIIALTVVYAHDVLQGTILPYPQSYAAIDMAIGFGNLIGGFTIGAIGTRWRKGGLVIAGYLVMGLATALMGATGNEVLALACALLVGVANMAFSIPTQTLFAERTPQDLMGRVIGIRFSMVLGPLTLAMAVSGLIAQLVGPSAAFIGFGLLTAVAGVAGLFLPAVRDA